MKVVVHFVVISSLTFLKTEKMLRNFFKTLCKSKERSCGASTEMVAPWRPCCLNVAHLLVAAAAAVAAKRAATQQPLRPRDDLSSESWKGE